MEAPVATFNLPRLVFVAGLLSRNESPSLEFHFHFFFWQGKGRAVINGRDCTVQCTVVRYIARIERVLYTTLECMFSSLLH